jgi:DNA-binding response OmpR family regulator
MSGPRILVVDDEAPIAEAVAYSLRQEGYGVSIASDALECLEAARRDRPDLIVLDVMLPSGSGLDICRTLRKRNDRVPIILLTARAEEADRVIGLELGADDYVTKPFSMRELVARVRTVLRRTSSATGDAAPAIRVGDLSIDPASREVRVGVAVAELTAKEFDLLYFLAANPGRVFTRQLLLDRVWGADAYVDERTIDVYVRWLRSKIETDPARPARITTVRGVGYKLAAS